MIFILTICVARNALSVVDVPLQMRRVGPDKQLSPEHWVPAPVAIAKPGSRRAPTSETLGREMTSLTPIAALTVNARGRRDLRSRPRQKVAGGNRTRF